MIGNETYTPEQAHIRTVVPVGVSLDPCIARLEERRVARLQCELVDKEMPGEKLLGRLSCLKLSGGRTARQRCLQFPCNKPVRGKSLLGRNGSLLGISECRGRETAVRRAHYSCRAFSKTVCKDLLRFNKGSVDVVQCHGPDLADI